MVLTDHTKQDIIQPLDLRHGTVEDNSALRSFNYASAAASFSLSDVDQIRGEDDKGEFFVVVVGHESEQILQGEDAHVQGAIADERILPTGCMARFAYMVWRARCSGL